MTAVTSTTASHALLLAHGSGGGIDANYGPIRGALASGGRLVVGFDLPGTGGAPRATEPLELDALADGLVAAADEAGVERFAVSGYSLGTTVAVRAATRHPERVTALVLTAPFACADHALRQSSLLWRDLADSGRHELVARLLVPLVLGSATLDPMTPEAVEGLVRLTAESVPAGTPEHADLVTRADVREELGRVGVPTLVISTTEDRLVAPALHRAVAAGIPGARLTELATGHAPFAENPEAWGKLITEFLGLVERGAVG
ncbi:alpha/beta hydrolase [Streptomyces sp. Je 1-79]|uniref:alpha/beta fold hydrolase n=1 Tax=Streptomyces sp. Je 1-79 TaxID=2943847 RepID=UPI0021A2F81B|nr:alpha/beta hydrolase [Streptomyces sp. Je 1-79]MCT4356127.1 alpha/beta hydrolase [Streptomyces sp. Je 1-79]